MRGINRLKSFARRHPGQPSGTSKKAANVSARRDLASAGALDLIVRFNEARPSVAFQPVWSDLWVMYALVRDRQPARLLELGGGVSTAALAAALRANGHGHLWSVDSSQEWAASTREALPAELREFVTVSSSPKVRNSSPPRNAFESLPEIVPDFVYLDGPGRDNVLDLEPKLDPGFTLLIDGRHGTARYLRERLTREYEYEEQRVRYIFTLLA